VLDLETQRLANEVGGWKNAHLMRVSVGVLYDSLRDEYLSYQENKVHHLLKQLETLDMVVGFNIKGFDYSVLSAYTSFDLNRYFTLDLLRDIHAQLGFRLSLQALGEATFGLGKSADGLMAVEWFRKGEIKKLTEYCRRDVELTRDLFLYGQEKGYLLYQRKNGPKLRVPVDWSWESLKKRKKEHH
jgi:DEAD/DEAH box helicase domain-containing protein